MQTIFFTWKKIEIHAIQCERLPAHEMCALVLLCADNKACTPVRIHNQVSCKTSLLTNNIHISLAWSADDTHECINSIRMYAGKMTMEIRDINKKKSAWHSLYRTIERPHVVQQAEWGLHEIWYTHTVTYYDEKLIKKCHLSIYNKKKHFRKFSILYLLLLQTFPFCIEHLSEQWKK